MPVQAFSVGKDKQKANQDLLDRLNEVVGREYEGRFIVKDFSMHNYAHDIHGAPREFFILVRPSTFTLS